MVNVPCAEAGCKREWGPVYENTTWAHETTLTHGWWADLAANYWCPEHRVNSASYMLRLDHATEVPPTPKNPLPPVSREEVDEWIRLATLDGSSPTPGVEDMPKWHPSGDTVRHPSHYTSSPAKCSGCGKPIECIDVTKHMMFNVGNMIKYLWRLGRKGDSIEDLRKVIQYAEFEIARLTDKNDAKAETYNERMTDSANSMRNRFRTEKP